jgi:hypothetical protein
MLTTMIIMAIVAIGIMMVIGIGVIIRGEQGITGTDQNLVSSMPRPWFMPRPSMKNPDLI